MGKINRQVFKKEMSKAFSKSKVKHLAFEEAQKKIDRIKREALIEFKQHPVSKELRSGKSANNISNTLGGRGNLFTFIGFQEGEDPTFIVERAIQDIRINRTARIREIGRSGRYEIAFTATFPNVKSLESVTPMPFEGGRSWLTAIERGISGLSYYIYSRVNDIKASRSGKGIQSDSPYIPGLKYRPVGYISSILGKIRNSIKS